MSMRGEVAAWSEMEALARKKMVEEAETESSGSSEAETESPRSVGRWTAKERVHSQVLKIRGEDLCVLESRRYLHDHPHGLSLFLISRPNLPCSPLSGKVRSVNAVQ
ncbi:unnamed protein product [Eruca vesicaria subsp. sativa]|uniref:Uncharacterized protein n=1 Tax=Eruca vesicaria subsp. sativa TaxID=29727 RepID=A0ABC8JHA3_ERUVS|nr:unnamed protein product [Eruca vesicaria subsp. sativa]